VSCALIAPAAINALPVTTEVVSLVEDSNNTIQTQDSQETCLEMEALPQSPYQSAANAQLDARPALMPTHARPVLKTTSFSPDRPCVLSLVLMEPTGKKVLKTVSLA